MRQQRDLATRYVLAVILILACGAAACDAPSMVVRKPERVDVDRALTEMWAREVRRTAESGDWILTRSYSMTGDLITFATAGENVSHASVYDAERGTIIEAISPIVREVPLEHLINRNHYVIVVRPAGLSEEERLASVVRARSAVGSDFDVMGIFGAGNDATFYCSELVAWASRVRIAPGSVVTPAELIDHGTVVYFSGERDDPAVQSAAVNGRALRRARVAAASRPTP